MTAQAVRVTFPGHEQASGGDALVSLPVASLQELHQQVASHFGASLPRVRRRRAAPAAPAAACLTGLPPRDAQGFLLNDTERDCVSDADAAALRDGTTLVVTSAEDRALAAPARERISFQPHPKTLTMAGDYEYFAAQGRHPFVYAVAEFIDNSLRATRHNGARPRSITVSLVVSGTNPATAKGLIAVTDNGCGMSKHELNDWVRAGWLAGGLGSAGPRLRPSLRCRSKYHCASSSCRR